MEIYKRSYKTQSGEVRTSYLLDATIGDRRIRRTLKGAESLKHAKRLASGILQELEAELESKGKKKPRALPLQAILEEDRKRAGVSDFTRRQEAASAKHLVRLLGKGFDLSRLSGADVEAYSRKRSEETFRGAKISARTVNLDLELLRAVLTRLVEHGRLPALPCRVKTLARIKKSKRALSRAEALALLEACRQFPGLFNVTAFLLNTGLRRSELFCLRWEHLDLAQGTMTVLTKKKGTSGTVYEDRVPLNGVCLGILREMRGAGESRTGLVFGKETRTKGKAGTVDGIPVTWDHTLRDRLKEAAKRAGIEWWNAVTPHTLRHTFGSLSIRSGATLRDVSSLMRHRDPMMTVRTYLHEQESAMRAAVDALSLTVPGAPQAGAESEPPPPQGET